MDKLNKRIVRNNMCCTLLHQDMGRFFKPNSKKDQFNYKKYIFYFSVFLFVGSVFVKFLCSNCIYIPFLSVIIRLTIILTCQLNIFVYIADDVKAFSNSSQLIASYVKRIYINFVCLKSSSLIVSGIGFMK